MGNLLGVRHSLTLKKQLRTAREGGRWDSAAGPASSTSRGANETRCLAFIRLRTEIMFKSCYFLVYIYFQIQIFLIQVNNYPNLQLINIYHFLWISIKDHCMCYELNKLTGHKDTLWC